jgi:hypothetical protein
MIQTEASEAATTRTKAEFEVVELSAEVEGL